MNEKTLLPGNRECSHKFRTMPIKHPRCGQFVTPIKDVICYPLNIKYISQCIENFKIIMQRDAMQCGIASLAMIVNYYGRDILIEELSEICFASSEGVSLKGLCDAAINIGLNPDPRQSDH